MVDSAQPEKTSRRRREVTPAQRALALLVRREHSRKELALKLRARGIEAAEADAAVERMASAGWQDDARFACSLVRTRAAAGYGPIHIRAELASHGIGHEAIGAAFSALSEAGDDDWRARARALVLRRFGSQDSLPLPMQRKAADFLLRRGYDSDCIRFAIGNDGD
ncbi:regulatory protein RecX [Cognatiluteimonas profundi]|uniref:regulatory protein RecX n=1 Tax=Cognatiluteimonas profundi TaxID=2594501 RepID=UPI00131E4B34|nr:regulatory protein RecX [Lysobacter profundi]